EPKLFPEGVEIPDASGRVGPSPLQVGLGQAVGPAELHEVDLRHCLGAKPHVSDRLEHERSLSIGPTDRPTATACPARRESRLAGRHGQGAARRLWITQPSGWILDSSCRPRAVAVQDPGKRDYGTSTAAPVSRSEARSRSARSAWSSGYGVTLTRSGCVATKSRNSCPSRRVLEVTLRTSRS